MKEQVQSFKKELEEHLLGKSAYNNKGEEIPDPTPVALPIGFRRPISLADKMRALVKSELVKSDMEGIGAETFEDADDFDVGEGDPLDGTPYEDNFDPERPGAIAREQELRAGYVEDIRPEKKAKARETLEKHKKKPEPKAKED